MEDKDNVPDYFGHRERIRQKYIQSEGKGMADYELLELLLTYALPRKDVKPIAKALIKEFGDLNGVISAPASKLIQINGIKENSAILIKIIKTCALRGTWESLNENDAVVVSNWDVLEDYCRNLMAHLEIEEFHVVYLNTKLQIMKEEKLQGGTVDKVLIHPKEIIKAAIDRNAKGVILIHNHPSGNPTPSERDRVLTKKIVEMAKCVDLCVFNVPNRDEQE